MVDHRLVMGPGPCRRDMQAILLHRQQLREIVAAGDQVLEITGLLGQDRARHRLLLLREAGQQPGIGAVGLGALPFAADEGMGLLRIEHRGRHPRRRQGAGDAKVVAPGRFEHDARGGRDPGDQRRPACVIVGDAEDGALGQKGDIEVRLADVDPTILRTRTRSRHGVSFHGCVR